MLPAGCSYLENRSNDLLDVFPFGVGFGEFADLLLGCLGIDLAGDDVFGGEQASADPSRRESLADADPRTAGNH